MVKIDHPTNFLYDEDFPQEEAIIENDKGSFKISGRLAMYYKQGYFEPGWDIEDYNRNAINTYGWEMFPTWGTKGARKSNRLMCDLYSIYGEWPLVHEHLVMKPKEFTDLLKPQGRKPMIGWDDIAAWFDAQLYFQNRGLYTNIKRCWTLMRTNLNVFSCTLPNKEELPGFMAKDMTAESKCSPRLTRTYDRWTLSKNIFDPRKVIKKPVNIFMNRPFDMYEVPTEQFKIYWERRMDLATVAKNELVSYLEEAFEDTPNIPDYVDQNIDSEDYQKNIMKLCARVSGSRKPENKKQRYYELIDAVQHVLKK